MTELKAFVGHSFTENDKEVVRQFTDFFDNVKNMGIGFSWAHAEPAEPKVLSEKVLELMEGKNLFIAICTAKELVTAPDKLKKILFNRNMLKVKNDELEKKTSDWIIQEIGIAIGKNMDIITLIEDGLRAPGELQGNLERIEFNRNEPSKSFNKILEMLRALVPTKAIDNIAQMEVLVTKEAEAIEEKKGNDFEPSEDWTKSDFENALFNVIARGDEEQEKKIIKTYFESVKEEADIVRESFTALKLYFRQILRKGASVEELKVLCTKYPNNSDIAFYLGKAYEEYKDFNKAAEQYEISAEFAENDKEKLACFCNTAEAKCKDGFKDSDGWLMNKVRDLFASVEDGQFRLLTTLKNISEIENNNDKYLAYSEGMLDIRPGDEDLRFSLAYKYAELEKNELALFHYLLIPNKDRSSGTWNNIGVAHANLGIDGKAVSAYRESEKMDGTIAMSNLAKKLIKAGFLREAEKICGHAITIENYDKEIGTAITSIKKTRENEDDKEEKALKDNEKRRRFYIDYGMSSIKHPPESQEHVWIGPQCELFIEIKGRSFIAKGSYERKKFLGAGLAYAYGIGSVPPTEKTVITNMRYEGTLTGYGIEYKLYVEKEGKKSTLSTALSDKEPSKQGLMLIADDMTEIRVYEKGTKETDKFYEFKRK